MRKHVHMWLILMSLKARTLRGRECGSLRHGGWPVKPTPPDVSPVALRKGETQDGVKVVGGRPQLVTYLLCDLLPGWGKYQPAAGDTRRCRNDQNVCSGRR